ncbi:MAG: hypothetical protein B6242_06815 [Anaerolineaceae bacterium 4572_78]|nr:MAG: hypothetical protein B6242_06815 [Anaerolineaceae bacterium 4572_78]
MGTNINFNELSTGQVPVVFLVNGLWGCDPCICRKLHDDLQKVGITVYDCDWDDIHRRPQGKGGHLTDTRFVKQMLNEVFPKIPEHRPIVMIGHSFGADSILKVARDTSRRISLLGVLDGVRHGGVRTKVEVRNNVDYFYNRWTKYPTPFLDFELPILGKIKPIRKLQTISAETISKALGMVSLKNFEGGIPINADHTGHIPCHHNHSDQAEQSFATDVHGNILSRKAKPHEVTAKGYNPLPRWLPGGKKGWGTVQRKRRHGGDKGLYLDEYIQKQLYDLIMLLAFTPMTQTAWALASNGVIPNGAFVAGHDSEGLHAPLYIARTMHAGGMHPGKIRHEFGWANIPWGGREITINPYQVFMGSGHWVKASNGHIPAGAIVGGRDEDNNADLFIARASHAGGMHPGKIRHSWQHANIPWGGQELLISDYEVLVGE